MIKVKVNNEYKDVVKIFCGGTLQKEIIKVWSREAQEYVYESSVEYTGSLPITITANGNALLDYRIYGADGGVGVATESGEPAGYKLPMTVQSANLFDKNATDTNNGYVYNRFLRVSGSISKTSGTIYIISEYIKIKPDKTYTIADFVNKLVTDPSLCFYDENRDYISGMSYNERVLITFRTPNNARYIRFSLINDIINNTMLTEGSDGNTSHTVPVYIGENQLDSVEGVADYVDKSSGKIVRMIGEYTFTGDEGFNKYGNSDVFYTSKTIDPVGITTDNTITMRCNHPAFTAIENKDTRYWLNPEADNICCFLPGGMSQVFLHSTSNFTTAAECKAYLKAQYDNGTPVKISYWLKTPAEEDPPVPLPEIPTIDGTTIIDYDGTPKPSQMYVKYRR